MAHLPLPVHVARVPCQQPQLPPPLPAWPHLHGGGYDSAPPPLQSLHAQFLAEMAAGTMSGTSLPPLPPHIAGLAHLGLIPPHLLGQHLSGGLGTPGGHPELPPPLPDDGPPPLPEDGKGRVTCCARATAAAPTSSSLHALPCTSIH